MPCAIAKDFSVPDTLIGLDGDKREKSRAQNDLSMNDDQLVLAKELWLEKIRVRATDPLAFMAHSHFIRLLYAWREYGSEDEPRAWVASTIADPKLLPALLAAFMTTRESHTQGDFVTRRRRAFELENLEPFVDLDVLASFVTRLDDADMGEDEQAARKAFVEAVAERRKDHMPSLQSDDQADEPDSDT